MFSNVFVQDTPSSASSGRPLPGIPLHDASEYKELGQLMGDLQHFDVSSKDGFTLLHQIAMRSQTDPGMLTC